MAKEMISLSASHSLGLLKTAAEKYEEIIQAGKYNQEIVLNYIQLLLSLKRFKCSLKIYNKYLGSHANKTTLKKFLLLYMGVTGSELRVSDVILSIRKQDFVILKDSVKTQLNEIRQENKQISTDLTSLVKRKKILEPEILTKLRDFAHLDKSNCTKTLQIISSMNLVNDCIFFRTRLLHLEYNTNNIFELVKLYLTAANLQLSKLYLNEVDLKTVKADLLKELHNFSLENDFYDFYLASGKVLSSSGLLGKGDIASLIKTCFSKQRYDDAEIFIEVLTSQNKNDPDAYFYKGNLEKIRGRTDKAVLSYRKSIALDERRFDSYFNLGNCYRKLGDDMQAIKAYKQALKLQPSLLSAKHLIDSLEGNQTATAPREYVEGLFDSYASTFDASLVQILEYELPKTISVEIENFGSGKAILDMGCGTGLLGSYLNEDSFDLIGVDLSTNMLKEASKRDCYSELHKMDISQYLETTDKIFDIIVAADVFIYVGKLDNLFLMLKQRLSTGGLLIFSTEDSSGKGYELLKSGRYAHSARYIENLAKSNSFKIHKFEDCQIRNENTKKIMGKYCVLIKQ